MSCLCEETDPPNVGKEDSDRTKSLAKIHLAKLLWVLQHEESERKRRKFHKHNREEVSQSNGIEK